MTEWALVTKRLPLMPKHKSERQLRRLTHRALAELCWAATVNEDFASMAAAEWQARAAELADMLEGVRPVDPDLLRRMREHRAHVVACRAGVCEHNYAALVRAGMEQEIFAERSGARP